MRATFSSLRQKEYHSDDMVRLYENTQTDHYPAHWNNSFEIIVPVENTYTARVGNITYTIGENEVLIIPAGSVHELIAPDSGKRYIIMADQSLFYSVPGLAGVQHYFYPCLYLNHSHNKEMLVMVRTYIETLVQVIREKDYFSHVTSCLTVSQMFVFIARNLMAERKFDEKRSIHRQHRAINVFLEACAYISEHCAEKLTLADVAAYIGYSKYHFARMFKTYSGMSFYDFFMRQRILLCEQLLRDPTLPITEVALRSGFGSITTFNRIFKQFENMTPREYRQFNVNNAFDETIPAGKTAISEQ